MTARPPRATLERDRVSLVAQSSVRHGPLPDAGQTAQVAAVAGSFTTLPICIISYNRPDYLEQTLRSLATAIERGTMTGQVVLFQDGAIDPRTGSAKTDPALIRACITAFRTILPGGTVIGTDRNFGIANNIYRAERWAFDHGEYPAALFFEDDMVVSPRFFQVMARLHALAVAEPRIAMYSAYGSNFALSANSQREQCSWLGRMHHNWAFGLTRSAWLAREAYTAPYMTLLEECDYRDRPLLAITRWYSRMGWPPLPTNQDRAKTAVLNRLGYVRLTCNAVCGRYIGREGQHYTPQMYSAFGFDRIEMLEDVFPDEEWDLQVPDTAALDRWVAEERAELLAERLGRETFLRDAECVEMMRVLSRIDPASSSPGVLVAEASSVHDDGWFGPVGTIGLRADLPIRRLRITGLAAQHLPPGTTIAFTLNGKPLTIAAITAGEQLKIDLPMPAELDGLEKLLLSRCSVAIDAYSVGFNADRRAISWMCWSIVVDLQDGTELALRGDALRAELREALES